MAWDLLEAAPRPRPPGDHAASHGKQAAMLRDRTGAPLCGGSWTQPSHGDADGQDQAKRVGKIRRIGHSDGPALRFSTPTPKLGTPPFVHASWPLRRWCDWHPLDAPIGAGGSVSRPSPRQNVILGLT